LALLEDSRKQLEKLKETQAFTPPSPPPPVSIEAPSPPPAMPLNPVAKGTDINCNGFADYTVYCRYKMLCYESNGPDDGSIVIVDPSKVIT